MEYATRTNGWLTFLEHWNLAVVAAIAVGISEALNYFFTLQGKSWIRFFSASVVLLICGAALIVRANIPTWRSGRLFMFGVNSVPKKLAGSYRWGWRAFLFGVVLSLCLLLSRQ